MTDGTCTRCLAGQGRLGEGTLGGVLDWLTMGLVSGFAQGLGDRWGEMVQSPSLYHTANWLSLGFAGEVKGAVAPEEPLSLEHWLHSLGVVSALYSAYAMGKGAARDYRQAAELEKMAGELGGSGAGKVERPSWRQSELDAAKDFPDYSAQKSLKKMPDGTIQEVPYGTKGSVRPDYYKTGHSVDIKNYNVTTFSGRRNLKDNITKQYYQRLKALPSGTKQTVIIDVRGQTVTDSVLDSLYNDIMESTKNGIEIRFKIINQEEM